ncbi:hypothetical protein SAMN05428642_1021025 [Flaviramulus basaltis]|uniref:3-keto-disaccharide hydrolase domain-containing protein n=1 Tax=Flaviramulus basaltis TaxID=369401 RepID=A0A1K2IKJ7_9FLAO|nr:DUF1080 domain-containing protein [Flaviramulus basaltis]SFZ92830.1 hypothetical protein SAMN05428642_1021025 [Flaviramulus basaltis]
MSIAILNFQKGNVSFYDNNWAFSEGTIYKIEQFDGKETLVLNGRAELKKSNFNNGIIEVDILANSKRSFAELSFRKQNGSFEEVYLRMHKSKQPDALQYTPIFNGESNWQLYSEHQAFIEFNELGWNHLRVVVSNTSADVFVNHKKVFTISQLKTDNVFGAVGLFSLFDNRFSNFKVTNSSNNIDSNNKVVERDSTIINQWQISEARLYNVDDSFTDDDFKNLKYFNGKTEVSGLLPISKYVKKTSFGKFENNSEDFVVAQVEVNSEIRQSKRFLFDYSDRVIVYLNGVEMYNGNNAFRSKGPQYMGHLNREANSLNLNLKQGKNILRCIVIERSNGWGIMGKFEDVEGIEGSWQPNYILRKNSI